MHNFAIFHNLTNLLFSEIVILRGRPNLLFLVWLQTELDSTQFYYYYKILTNGRDDCARKMLEGKC